MGRGQLLRRAGPGARRALLASFDAMGYLVHSASSVEAIAVLAAAQGEARLAERLLGAAAGQLKSRSGDPGSERFAHDDAAKQSCERAWGRRRSPLAWETGRVLTQGQAVDEALAWADAAT